MKQQLIRKSARGIEEKYKEKHEIKSPEETSKFKMEINSKMIKIKKEYSKKEIESIIAASKSVVSY